MSKGSSPPTVRGHVRSVASQTQDFDTMLYELADNSIDAISTRVDFEIDVAPGKKTLLGATLRVRDNGIGCRDMGLFQQLGGRHANSDQTSGRFGVGFGAASLWLGGQGCVVDVESVRDGVHRTLRIDWEQRSEQNNWDWETVDRPASADDIGTIVTVGPIVKAVRIETVRQAIANMGYVYAPAMRRKGVRLYARVGSEPLVEVPQWEVPPWVPGSLIRETVSVDGKTATVCAGLVKDGHPNPRCGLTYMAVYRVILPSRGSGLGSAPLGRICGWVQLDDKWSLATNKNGFDGADDLFEEVERALAPLTEKACRLAATTPLSVPPRLAKEIRSMGLRLGVGADHSDRTAKAKRGKGNRTGTATPTGRGGKHAKAAAEQSGDRFARRQRKLPEVRIEFVELDPDQFGNTAGHCDEGTGRILLNLNNSRVRRAQKTGDVDTLLAIARPLFAAWFLKQNAQASLAGEQLYVGPTHVVIGRVLADLMGE